MILPLPLWLNCLAAVIVLVLGSARLGRLIVHDTYPPVAWLRAKWDDATSNSGWNELLHCHWCATPWITLTAVGVFALGFAVPWVFWVWWIGMGTLGASYLAGMIIERDQKD